MSLKSTFFALKKIVQVFQIGGGGGVCVIWTKSNRRAVVFCVNVPIKQFSENVPIKIKFADIFCPQK